jgi:hypothetical protein
VRHLVELHHGRVEAFSEGVGHGSDFVVRLPILASVPDAPDPEPSSKPASRTGRVMIVDDDRDAAESMALVLQIYGYEVAFVSDLDSALRTGAELSPQVVILDLGMPGADGYEVATQAAHPAAAGRRDLCRADRIRPPGGYRADAAERVSHITLSSPPTRRSCTGCMQLEMSCNERGSGRCSRAARRAGPTRHSRAGHRRLRVRHGCRWRAR